MADIKQEYREWLAKNGVKSDKAADSYCSAINVWGFWNGDRSAIRQKLAELFNKENKTSQESNQLSYLKKFRLFLSEKAKKEQELAGAKAVHETAKTSSDIDWEPAVEGKPQFGTFTDIRDGQKYKCFKIGNQVWMAENLRYEGGWATTEGSLENLNDVFPDRLSKEGESLKYTWAAVMNMPSCMNKIALPLYDKMVTEGYESSWNANEFKLSKYQGIAPIGWHIPSVSEFMTLKENIKNEMVRFEEDAEKMMGSLFEDGIPYEMDDSVSRPVWLWTVNESGSDSAVIFITTGWENRPSLENKSNHYFLRCIKNAD